MSIAPREMPFQQPDELVREPGVLGDHPLELLEADARPRGHQRRQRAEPVRRAGTALDQRRLREEQALELIEAERAADVVVLARVDPARDQREITRTQPLQRAQKRGAREVADVELDRVRVLG